MNIPEDLRYTRDHEWVRSEDGRVTVGISDFAQAALGDIVYVERPTQGDDVAAGASCGEIESTKSVSEILAPVSRTVVPTNELVVDHPELLNTDPYGEGWICVIAPDDLSAFDSLLSPADYAKLVAEEESA
jgi:glycine cleavage system H protein